MDVHRMHRAYAACISLLAAVLLCTTLPSWAQTGKTPALAPPNAEFIRYQDEASAGQLRAQTDDGYALGLIPSPVDLSHTKYLRRSSVGRTLSLPASYDLRTTGKLTAVRNQGGCGSCWSFAAYGSMESCLLPGESRDFSENNLKNLSGFDIPCCDGGNHLMTTAYLARWNGPVNEADDAYNGAGCTSPTGTTVRKHVQKVVFLPDRNGSTDNDAIKQAVMTYGAVYTSMHWNNAYYHSGNCSYYCGSSAGNNHAVCIIGWDDNYDRSRFLVQPPANGAFIIRNSWGTGWGQSGYFYVSYYDVNAVHDNAVFCGNAPVSNYNLVYQYDTLGWVTSVGYGSNTAWGANVFAAVQDGQVSAVGFYAASPNTAYEIYIHINPNYGPINTSGWAALTTGTVSDAGYHTIPVDSLVTVRTGQKFSAVVKLTTPGYNYPIPVEAPQSFYSSTARANAGQSFISSDGGYWSDVTASYSNNNVCIKAFSNTASGLVVTPSSDLTTASPVGGPIGQYGDLGVTYTLTNTASTAINWTASNSQPWVTLSAASGALSPGSSTQVAVSFNPAANGLPAGVHTDTVSFTNTSNGIGNATRDVVLIIRNAQLAVEPSEGYEPLGAVGGPFAPAAKTYTIRNTGYSDLHWSASKSRSWVSLSATGGVIHPQEQAQVTVSTNSGANGLHVGTYSDSIAFTNVTNGDGSTSRAVNLSVCRNYVLLPTAYAWISPNGHKPVSLTDDEVSGAQSLPFAFTFYGQQYSQVYIGANGLIGFGGSSGLGAYDNTDIPSSDQPNAVLYPYWDDLNPSSGGSVKVGTEGTSPNRRCVISWLGVPHYSSSNLALTFQVVMHETSNDITFQYQEVQAGNTTYGSGRSATVGIEDSTGRIACKYSCNGSALLSSNQAFVFAADPTSIADVRKQPDGELVTVRGGIVTWVASSSFYIESEDRSSGISVYKSSHDRMIGARVDVTGLLSTNVSGERYINATSLTQNGTGSVEPVRLINSGLGGADWEYDPSTGAGQKGIKDAVGLNNIGTLVCTTGKVTYVGADYFYVDDGSGAGDDSGHRGVKISVTGLTLPVLDKFVTVSGVSSCAKTGSDLYRLLKATSITVVNP